MKTTVNKETKGADRRRVRLISRKFQLGLAWRVLLVYLVFVCLGIAVLFGPSMYLLASNTASLSLRESAAAEFLLLHRRAWPALLLSFGGVFVYSLILGHRIAGPVARTNQVLRKMIDGEPAGPVKFRKNDYFQPTAELLTILAEKLSRPLPETRAEGLTRGRDDR